MTQPFSPTHTYITPEWTEHVDDLNRFNDVMRSVAWAEGVTLIDLLQHVSQDVEGWDQPTKVFYDGIHVTPEGARVYADCVTKRLLESVPALQTPRRALAQELPSARSR